MSPDELSRGEELVVVVVVELKLLAEFNHGDEPSDVVVSVRSPLNSFSVGNESTDDCVNNLRRDEPGEAEQATQTITYPPRRLT